MNKLLFTLILPLCIITAPVRTIASSTKTENSLNSLLETYLQIKNSLVSGESAQLLAKDFLQKTTEVNQQKLSVEEQKAWHTSSEAIIKDAQGISSTSDIEKQRKYFSSLSVHLYPVIKILDIESKLYYQYCPMYNNGKGAYWFSEKSNILNPYYGKKMLTCGSIKETIN